VDIATEENISLIDHDPLNSPEAKLGFKRLLWPAAFSRFQFAIPFASPEHLHHLSWCRDEDVDRPGTAACFASDQELVPVA
jgi:hypothetical protein